MTTNTALVITGHNWRSCRRAGFHVLTEALAEEGLHVGFATYGRIWSDLLRRGDERGWRTLRSLQRGSSFPQGRGSVTNFTVLGWGLPGRISQRAALLDRVLTARSNRRFIVECRKRVPQPRWVFVESTAAVMLWPALRDVYPQATFVYRPSDPLLARPEIAAELKEAEKQVVSDCDVLLLVNEDGLKLYRDLNLLEHPKQMVRVLPNGLDLARFREKYPLPEPLKRAIHPIVVYAGASGPNWSAILKAAERLPAVTFCIVCPVHPHLATLKAIQLLPNVIYVPGVPPSDVPAYITSAAAVIVPYPEECRHWTRGLHSKIYQAMAAHKPIVGLNMGRGVNGYGLMLTEDQDEFVRLIERAVATGDYTYDIDLGDLDWSQFKRRFLNALYEATPPAPHPTGLTS